MSGLLLFIVALPIANIAVKFGPFEYALLIIIGLILSVRVDGKNDKAKAAMVLFIGMFCSVVGTDHVTGVNRLTFGIIDLMSGINLLPFLVGIFAISQVMFNCSHLNKTSINQGSITDMPRIKFPSLKKIKSNIGLLSVSSIIGFFIGVLPGVGGSLASIMAYFTGKRLSSNQEKFGTGCIEGVMASEASNNSMTGGALITTLALSIPGESCTAVIMGGMTLLGIRTGSNLFETHLNFVYEICCAFIVANLCMLLFQLIGMNIFLKLLLLPKHIIYSVVLILSTLGVYCSGNNFFDVYVMIFFGILGYILKCNNYNLTPMVMGFILCPMLEKYIRLTVSVYRYPSDVIFSPISIFFISVILLLLFSFSFRGDSSD